VLRTLGIYRGTIFKELANIRIEKKFGYQERNWQKKSGIFQ
jgi:hypothetical protein